MYIELAYPEQQRTLDGTGKLTEAVIQYLVFEALDEAEALAYAFEEVPKELEELKLLSVTITERKSEDIFLIEVTYGVSSSSGGSDDDDEDEEATVNFDCTTGSGHVTSALETVILKSGSIDPGDAIGWNGKTDENSEITGVEKMVPTLTETYTKVMRVSQLNNAFRRKVAGLTAKINSKSFKGWDRGEVLFLGCSFTAPEKNAEKVTVSFNFAIRLDESSSIAGTKFTKDGWTYVWTISEPAFVNGKPAVNVTGIYGSRVYEYADFGALGL